MNFRRFFLGLMLLLCGQFLSSCGSVLAPTLPTPMPTPAPTPGLPIIMAAGDISCDSDTPALPCMSLETSDLIRDQIPLRTSVTVLPLGDLQYDSGTLAEFRKNYDRTWGRLNSISHPVPGNHEYLTSNARGYFDYFDFVQVAVRNPQGEPWYSFNVGDWHFVALNSNCDRIGGCGTGSPQYRWLAADLSISRSRCTVAYMHYPFWSSGANGNNPELLSIMRLLYTNKVDIVLAGHDHNYERFRPVAPDGPVDDPVNGLRTFVVGTGGRDSTDFKTPLGHSVTRLKAYGALRIEMGAGVYQWEYVPIAGQISDFGTGTCS